MSAENTEVVVTTRDIRLVIAALVLLGLQALALIFTVAFLVRQATTFARVQGELTRAARVARADHLANCSFKASLRQQVRSSEAYLKKHPDGAPALGITAAQIESQIRRQKAAVKSLSDLDCRL